MIQNAATRLADRARGCILAGAIGDAMGGPFEGQPGPLQFRNHTNWNISDDTQLTIATCESIIEIGKVSPEHIAGRFVQWFRDRRIMGMGASTLKALRDLDAGHHWALTGAKGEMSAGNGAAMRIAPLAFHLRPELEADRQTLRDVCRITHHNEEAYVGALALVTAIRSLAFDSASPDQLFESVLPFLPDSRVRDRIVEFSALTEEQTVAEVASQFGSSGYVVESVPLALYAARSITRLPLDAVLRSVIEAGGDTDTVACMTGQISGAWLGASQIPREVIERLPNARDIEQTANRFATTVAPMTKHSDAPVNSSIMPPETEHLFTYGTLQTDEVQLATFGRKLDGQPDALPLYAVRMIEIQDQAFVAKSGDSQHRTIQFTGLASDFVAGTRYSVTLEELALSDAYEPEGYKRELVQLQSGQKAWVYLDQENALQPGVQK